jgi:hypothetical protein
MSPNKVTVFFITPVIGIQKMEAASLRWDYIDIKSKTITLQDTDDKASHKPRMKKSRFKLDTVILCSISDLGIQKGSLIRTYDKRFCALRKV